MSYQGLTSLTQNGYKVNVNHWYVFVIFLQHMEEFTATKASEAQSKIAEWFDNFDNVYAIAVELHAGDNFGPAEAPEDRRTYFLKDEAGKPKLVDRQTLNVWIAYQYKQFGPLGG